MVEDDQIARDLRQLRQETRRNWRELRKLCRHVSRVHKRRNLGKRTKQRHLEELRRMGGMCPCCRRMRIVGAWGEKLPNLRWDHWRSRECNSINATWPVCNECNRRLEEPSFKSRKQNAFTAYQDCLLGPDGAAIQPDLFRASE